MGTHCEAEASNCQVSGGWCNLASRLSHTLIGISRLSANHSPGLPASTNQRAARHISRTRAEPVSVSGATPRTSVESRTQTCADVSLLTYYRRPERPSFVRQLSLVTMFATPQSYCVTPTASATPGNNFMRLQHRASLIIKDVKRRSMRTCKRKRIERTLSGINTLNIYFKL